MLNTGVNFVNVPMQTGLTVPPRDAAALASALNRLLDDEGLRQRLGQQARRRAQQRFDIEACAQATAALYQAVLNGQPYHDPWIETGEVAHERPHV